MNELDEIYLRSVSNETLGGDLTALNAVKWDRTEDQPDGTRVGFDDMTGQSFVLGKSEPPPAPAPAPSAVAPPPAEEGSSLGEFLGKLNVALDSQFSGLTKGVVNFLANTAGALGIVEQKDVDKFLKAIDEIDDVATRDNLPAKIGSAVGSLSGQYILPAVTGFNALRALGASRLLSSIVSEGMVGLLGLSPNDENLFNMIAKDTSSPAAAAVRDLLATDPDDSEWTNRVKNAGEALVLLGGSEALIRGLPKLVQQGKQFIKSDKGQQVVRSVEEMGARADERLRSVMRGGTLSANPIGAAGDMALSAAGKVAARATDEVPGQGVLFNKEITDNNLRLHRKRLDDTAQKGKPYPGGPKNSRRVIPAPEGSNLPDFVIGDITPEDWLARTEKLMSPDEIKQAANWYDSVYGEFLLRTGNDQDKAKRLMGAWLAAQQNESPANAMTSVLFMWEQISRGVPIENVKGKGLPSANKAALAVLSGKDIQGGVGQKIADFIDSAEKRDVRSIMGNDAAGGQPFVVDVHTGRDTGLVDKVLVNHLEKLGYDVPDDVIVDLAGGGIKGPQYENRAMFGRELTDYLNSVGWQGRSDWKPREIQAIGWMGITRMYGVTGVGGDSASAFGRNVRRISMEAAPGEGSPAAIKYGSRFYALDEAAQNDVTYKLTQKALDKVNVRLGINVGDIVHATGGWEKYTNPSTVQQAIASREAAQAAAHELGYLLQQTEVWVNTAKPLTKNPKGFAIDLVEKGSTTIQDNDALARLWQMAMDADNADIIKGYQPIETAAGDVGIRILVDRGGKGARAGIDEWLKVFGGMVENLPYNLRVILSEAEIYKARNNWKEQPDGNDYLSRGQKTGGDAGAENRADIDTDRQELEDYFGSLIDEAERGAK
jgi:hypothetical protein